MNVEKLKTSLLNQLHRSLPSPSCSGGRRGDDGQTLSMLQTSDGFSVGRAGGLGDTSGTGTSLAWLPPFWAQPSSRTRTVACQGCRLELCLFTSRRFCLSVTVPRVWNKGSSRPNQETQPKKQSCVQSCLVPQRDWQDRHTFAYTPALRELQQGGAELIIFSPQNT